MSKKVLFYSSQNARFNGFHSLNLEQSLWSIGGNSGNMVFTNAIQHYLEEADCIYDISDNPVDIGKASPEDYYCCIANCSNWIKPSNEIFLTHLTEIFRNTRIPVYFIGLGIQSHSDRLSDFDPDFKKTVKEFIGSVLDIEGNFGLRGHITADLFDQLGFKNHYTITGCPSIYQKGVDFQVSNNKKTEEEFKPVFNGSELINSDLGKSIFLKYPEGTFIDQDEFFKILQFPQEISESEIRNLLTRKEYVLNLIQDQRIKLFMNFNQWSNYLLSQKFNFSIGSRFHGNAISILNNIPSLILSTDSRVSELSDFFKIPTIKREFLKDSFDLYRAYLEIDYDDFNNLYKQRFIRFQDFIIQNNIPFKITNPYLGNTNNLTYFQNLQNQELSEIIATYLKFKPASFLKPVVDKRKQYFIIKRPWQTLKSIIKK